MADKPYKLWFDGRIIEWDEAQIHVMSHTLHYGLGVFEGIRVYEGHDGVAAGFRMKDHIDRLFASAHIAMIEIPYTKEEILHAICTLLKINGLKEAYVRPIVFIGHGSLGVHPRSNPIRVAIAAQPWGAYLGDEGVTKGIRAKISSYTRMGVNSFMTKAKICGNYVNSVLAKMEAVALGYDEALLLDAEGYVSEGSGENIFIARDGVLKTPPLTSILDGITRKTVLELSSYMGIEVLLQRFTRDELYIADEAFLTGTAAEITPIREVDDRKIGNATPGPITKALQKEFFRIVKGKNPKFKQWLNYIY